MGFRAVGAVHAGGFGLEVDLPEAEPDEDERHDCEVLARRTGCNLETVRYYEKIGMMPEPPRTASGYRVYDERHVARLRFILRGLLSLVDRGTQTCAEVKERTERHLADVRAKIADLKRIERVLAATAAQCSGEQVPECPVLEALAS